MEPESLWMLVAVLAVSGLIHGLTGFGFGIVAMTALPLVMDFKTASILVTLYGMLVSGLTLYFNRTPRVWHLGWHLVVGCCCGVPLGVWVLAELDSTWLARGMGLLLCLYVFYQVVLAVRWPMTLARGWGFPVGLVCGGLGGALNMSGPPAVMYAYAQPWTPAQAVGVLQVMFITSAVVRLSMVGGLGLIDVPLLVSSLWGLGPLVLSIVGSSLLLKRIPGQPLRWGVYAFLTLMGLKYLIFAT